VGIGKCFLGAGLLSLVIGQASCNINEPAEKQAAMQGCQASTVLTDLIEESPHCVLQRGSAERLCGDGQHHEVRYITPMGLAELAFECQHSLGMVYSYSGEIDASLLTLVQNITAQAESWDQSSEFWCQSNPGDLSCVVRRPVDITLFIDSPGGDAEAALAIGEIISNRAWSVFVNREAQCSSACIFLLAAARDRAVLGEVGIHRVYPSGSDASTTEDLARDLEEIVARAKALMQRNGVSPALVDDMMSIPSSDVRMLSREEQNAYGLGRENAAQVDLERIALERRCGRPFVERLLQAEAEEAHCAAAFWQPGEYSDYATCVNESNRQLGFPDDRCPNDGPIFWCGRDRADPARQCEAAQ
jgi:hypothetical protein